MTLENQMSVTASAPAKVNLALRVGARREDGYHQLDTVFMALDLFDDVTAFPAASAITMEIQGLGEDLPQDEQNLVIRAAKLLQEKYQVKQGAHLKVVKRIPVAAGMAGGSADAAATLVALNSLWKLELNSAQLAILGVSLGSDVPFALLGGIARGISRGENLSPIIPKIMYGWVILTNPKGLSTPEVFRKFDEISPFAPVNPADTSPVLKALENASYTELATAFENDLCAPALALRPDLKELFEKLENFGVGQILSGSGPSIAVLCEPEKLSEIAKKIQLAFPNLGVVVAIGPAAGAHLR